jgi:hypothetical protein
MTVSRGRARSAAPGQDIGGFVSRNEPTAKPTQNLTIYETYVTSVGSFRRFAFFLAPTSIGWRGVSRAAAPRPPVQPDPGSRTKRMVRSPV